MFYHGYRNVIFQQLDMGGGEYRGAGLAYDIVTARRLQNEKCLELYGFKVYSQHDEDGMIEEIFNRIGTTNKTFVEFGVENGLECNSHYLLHKGWRGLWLEGNDKAVAEINTRFFPAIRNGQLNCKRAFITKDNINELIVESGISGEIDLLSIDIDGNDYYVWHAINVIQPRVVVVEYNAKFPPNHNWKMAYNETHIWDKSDWCGASLKAFEVLGNELGYQLVGTNIEGTNAFFVQKAIADEHFILPATSHELYNPRRAQFRHYFCGHGAKYYLGNQLPNIGVVNYQPAEFAKLIDEKNKNNLSDDNKATAKKKFEALPKDKCLRSSHTNTLFFLPNGDVDMIQQQILLTEDYYEVQLLRTVAEKIYIDKETGVVVDAGAYIGNRLLFFGKELCVKKIIAFEPVEEHFSILKKNVELNGLSERTELHCMGLSNRDGNTAIGKVTRENMGRTSLSGNDGAIKLMRLDDFKLTTLSLLNIDVADMETEVLEGATDTIKRTRPVVLIKSLKYHLPDVEEFFISLGYVHEKIANDDHMFCPKKNC